MSWDPQWAEQEVVVGLFAGVIHGECSSSQLESWVRVEIHGDCLSSQLESWVRVERPLGPRTD